MIITITGTPGAGKTYFSKKLAKQSKTKYFDLNNYIKKNKLYDSYDKRDKTFDVDIKKLVKVVDPIMKKYLGNAVFQKPKKEYLIKEFLALKQHKLDNSIIIDSHLSHYLKSDLCIVITSDIKTLNRRLKQRDYSKKKIEDNIASEIFRICYEEAQSLNKHVILIKN